LTWQGNTVLRDLEIEIQVGEKVALIGESGAGKSTLLKALYQQRPDEIAFCQQAPALVSNLSLFHNIYMGLLAEHNFFYNALNLFFPQKAAKKKVSDVAQDLGLQTHLKASAETLSGGQQQRAALARTLIQDKEIFLGDEPVSAVDEIQAERLVSSIVNSHQTVVLALHNTHLALKYCQRVIGLKDGEIALDSLVSDLKADDLRAIYSENELSKCLDDVTSGSRGEQSETFTGLKLCR
jgi:phosphonate transport system ATP-binding protein